MGSVTDLENLALVTIRDILVFDANYLLVGEQSAVLFRQ